MATNTSVLIVGGSLNGLSTALFLAHRNVRCLVVERHPRTSIQYKFRGISPRSMEIYRSVGIEAEIRAHRTGDQKSGYIARLKNLADPKIDWEGLPWADTSDISPTTAATCDQDQLEPILKAHAERLGADVRFNTELVDFEQDEREVRALIRDRGTQKEERVTASYLVAADGTNGTTRERLGIERHGPGVLQHWMNVIFDTDVKPVLDGRPITSVFLTDINGTFVPRDEGRWLMAVQYVPERGQRPEDFTDEYCSELIRRGAGRSDVKVQIVDARPWDVAAYVADRYAKGRAFLVGDTAHVMPPTGGFGGNTGIHDAHNLAWKLDAVLRGAAGSRLLETYDSERRPVAERTLAQSLARLQAWFKDPSKKLPPAEKIVDDHAVSFGYLYRSGALAAEEGFSADEAFENPRAPSGRPGSRAAHVVVERAGERLSTLDLFNGRWALLAGPGGAAWCEAASRVTAAAAFALQCYRVGPEGDLRDVENRWSSTYGVSAAGAVLIRPDGFIAWRARDTVAQPPTVLRDVLERLSFRASHPPAGADGGGSPGIGRPMARLEDERFLRGGSRYVSDLIAASDALRVKVLRSPHAHARLLAVDATAARALPGVVAVLMADDLAGVADLPCDWVAPGMDVVPQHPVLARDRVRYAGEPIAAVAAETAHAAEDALAAIAVTYEKLPAVADQEAAMEEGATRIHDAVPSNVGYRYRRTGGDIGRAFAEAVG